MLILESGKEDTVVIGANDQESTRLRVMDFITDQEKRGVCLRISKPLEPERDIYLYEGNKFKQDEVEITLNGMRHFGTANARAVFHYDMPAHVDVNREKIFHKKFSQDKPESSKLR